MDRGALDHAKLRLEMASRAIEAFEAGETLADKKMAWTSFILAAAGVYTKLEQGAKSNPKSSAWFGRVKHERKTDELLQYMHQSRNADEHALIEVTAIGPHGAFFEGFGLSFSSMGGDYPVDQKIERQPPPAKFEAAVGGRMHQVTMGSRSVDLILTDIVDGRSKNTYAPPSNHLGNRINGISPANAARLTLERLRDLIKEGAAYVETGGRAGG